MDAVEGAKTFRTTGSAYDRFMGRYSVPLAELFADAAGVAMGQRVLDVGSGPGALTRVLVDRLGAGSVAACDPSPPFVEECAARLPGIDVRLGRVEQLPFDDGEFDAALAQLVLHFVSDPAAGVGEMRRAVRPGGVIGACVWDFSDGMEMLRHFWNAAGAVDPDAPTEARTLRFGRPGDIVDLFGAAGLVDIDESELSVSSTYGEYGELWSSLLEGIGPAGAFLLSLPDDRREQVRQDLYERVGKPDGAFTLGAVARCAVGRVPS